MTFSYEIQEYLGDNDTPRIALDPEKCEIYSYDSGGGMPEVIFNGRHINICIPPAKFSAESILDFFKSDEVQKILKSIMSSYRGVEWNGSNNVGRWKSSDGDLNDFEYERHDLEEMMIDNVACYWSMSEFASDMSAIADMIDGEKDAFKAAERIVDSAFYADILLDNNEVIGWLQLDENRYLLEEKMTLRKWLKLELGDDCFSEWIEDNYEQIEFDLDEEITRQWKGDEPDSRMILANESLIISTATATICCSRDDIQDEGFMAGWTEEEI
ncbi:MAG: hypothetical protein ACXADY_26900 [Candidatus Hodarchaeales archaeon]|jgi:hypothetical protein